MKNRKIALSFLFILSLFLVLNGCTPKITSKFENLVLSAAVDEEHYPITPSTTFGPTTPMIYLTGNVKDAQIDSVIIAEWYYLGGEEDLYLYQMTLEVTEVDMGFYISLSKPTDNWFLGDYEILLFYDNVLMETIEFVIE